jgi:hypothetical protein
MYNLNIRYTAEDGDHDDDTNEVTVDCVTASDPDDKLLIVVAYLEETDEVHVRVGDSVVWSAILSDS